MSTAQPFRPQKRRRHQLSCTECRRRKLKCDRSVPCDRCQKSGTAEICTYTTRDQSVAYEATDDFEEDKRDSAAQDPRGGYSPEPMEVISKGGLSSRSSRNRTLKRQISTMQGSHQRINTLENLLSERTNDPPLYHRDGHRPDCPPAKAGLRHIHPTEYCLHGVDNKTKFFGRSHWTSTFAQVRRPINIDSISNVYSLTM